MGGGKRYVDVCERCVASGEMAGVGEILAGDYVAVHVSAICLCTPPVMDGQMNTRVLTKGGGGEERACTDMRGRVGDEGDEGGGEVVEVGWRWWWSEDR